MIQRIQSVYLFLTALMASLFLKGSILTFNNNSGRIVMAISGIFSGNGETPVEAGNYMVPVIAIVVSIILMAVTAIFFFKKRKLQMKLTAVLITLCIIFTGALVYFSLSLMKKFQADIILNYKMFLPVLMIISSVLACGRIRKDEELVRSYDRLR